MPVLKAAISIKKNAEPRRCCMRKKNGGRAEGGAPM
jgi:hypothetical protein